MTSKEAPHMILYYSGTGNSAYIAKRIGKALGDEVLDLFHRLRERDHAPLHSGRPWVVVVPTYAWRIPRIVQSWLEATPLTGSRELYFVMNCGDGIGNAGKYLKDLCAKKGMEYRGCAQIVMPENYIAMFTTPDEEAAERIIQRAEGAIDGAIRSIQGGEPLSRPAPSLGDKLRSGPVNALFYPLFIHAKKFYVTEGCVSCGRCAAVCPLNNIRLEGGKPVWGGDCTHCMACISRCPVEAIEYGTHSRGLPRYTCDKEA